MMIKSIGQYSKSRITAIPVDLNSDVYKLYSRSIPSFKDQAVYVYSFKEGRMLYANGWLDLLGYKDEEINMLSIVNLTSQRYAKFSYEINDKALMFLSNVRTDLEEYSFTLETEKIHKNGECVPVFSRVGVYKATNGFIEEIIGVSQRMPNMKRGEVMQYAAYGPAANEFEETLNKELFQHFAISRKEKEALKLAAEGLSFKEIAHEVGVSQSAIEKRVIPLYKRFSVKSLPHLINFAHENHIL